MFGSPAMGSRGGAHGEAVAMAATASTLLLLVMIALIGFCKGEGAILDSTAPDDLTTAAKHLDFRFFEIKQFYRPSRRK